MALISNEEFLELKEYMRINYGIQLKNEKRGIVESRLQNVLIDRNIDNFSEYMAQIKNGTNSELQRELIEKLTTNYTYYMRELEHFKYFKNVVLPYLSKTVKDKDLRIWCAGCSTGEEAYMIAMTLSDFFGYEKTAWDTKILAVDISQRVLDKAIKGVYSAESLEDVPSEWKKKYFAPYDNNNMQVSQEIRDNIIFRRFNISQDTYSFKKKFHVIFCRNVMIYFDEATKQALIARFYDLLDKGGYLFIGQSESLAGNKQSFKYIMPSVYRKEE